MPSARRARRRRRGPYAVDHKTAVIMLRLTAEDKAAFLAAAEQQDLTLSDWLRAAGHRWLRQTARVPARSGTRSKPKPNAATS
jgi:hypothetical protein